MGILFLAIYLLIVGINLLFGSAIPAWVLGILALIAGIILLVENGLTYFKRG